MAERVVMNALYRDASDGTGTWTRSMLSAAPQIPAITAGFDPMRPDRSSFYRKVAYEALFRRRRARLRLHPYSAIALDPRAALVILNDAFDDEHRQGWHHALVGRSISMADRVATISRDQQRRLHGSHGRAFSLLTPFPDPAFFAPPVARQATADPAVTVAYWGGWHHRKGMLSALEAIEPSDRLHFRVTGSPPPQIRDRPDVTAVGRLDTAGLVALIDDADVAVYPSHDEGFGLPPYEAMLRGTPVVARALPSYGDFTLDGAPGLITFDRDDEFAAAVAKAASVGRVDPTSCLTTPTLEQARALLSGQLSAWLA